MRCTIRRDDEYGAKVTGPYNFGDKMWGWTWKNAWWNNSVHCVEIETVTVEYMDGDVEVFLKKELDKLYAPKEFRKKNFFACDW